MTRRVAFRKKRGSKNFEIFRKIRKIKLADLDPFASKRGLAGAFLAQGPQKIGLLWPLLNQSSKIGPLIEPISLLSSLFKEKRKSQKSVELQPLLSRAGSPLDPSALFPTFDHSKSLSPAGLKVTEVLPLFQDH